MNNKEIALKYANKGWYLFPSIWGIPAKNKSNPKAKPTHLPLCKWGTDSSNNPSFIEYWSSRHEDLYFCVDLKKSGLNVIDIDTKNDKHGDIKLIDLQLQYEELPKTLQVQTPSGGTHYLYNGGFKGQTTDKLGKGIDTPSMIPLPGSIVKGKGTYSIIADAPIASLPKWVSTLIETYSASKERTDRTDTDPNKDAVIELDLPHNLKAAKEYLLTAKPALQGEGADHLTYQTACNVRDFGVSKQIAIDYMLHYWYYPSCEPNNKPEFIETKVNNAYNYASTKIGETLPEASFKPVDAKGNPTIRSAILQTTLYNNIELPSRQHYLSPWLTSESISLITAYRGTGKTWFGMSLAWGMATGNGFGQWKCPIEGGIKVLYLEGEMAASSIQKRLAMLGVNPNLYIYSDSYASREGIPKADLKSPGWRAQLKTILLDMGIKVLFLDNLVSLTTGIDENSSKEWSPINEWLVGLRAAGVSVVMVHHTNKQGGQRGTSNREDPVDISIMLHRVDGHTVRDGARFICHFSKAREVDYEESASLVDTQFWLKSRQCTEEDEKNGHKGSVAYWETIADPSRLVKYDVLAMKDKGAKNSEISDKFDVTRQYVSKVLKEAEREKLIDKKGKLTAKGLDRIIENVIESE